MNAVIKYVAYDGREFIDLSACLKYERDCRTADKIIAQLPERPDSCDFSNGELGYIQHDRELFLKVRLELLEQAHKESPHDWLKQAMNDATIHSSWPSRIISECCTRQLCLAWNRISCVDSEFREWGQPYYANNPDKAPNKGPFQKARAK